jgi:hypothetical protein
MGQGSCLDLICRKILAGRTGNSSYRLNSYWLGERTSVCVRLRGRRKMDVLNLECAVGGRGRSSWLL